MLTKYRVGNETDAKFIADFVVDKYNMIDFNDGDYPFIDGWDFYKWEPYDVRRIIVKHKNVMYKVAINGLSMRENATEDYMARQCRENPLDGYYIPMVELFDFNDSTVLAMEFIVGGTVTDCDMQGYEYSWPDHEIFPSDHWDIDDLHGDNMIVMNDGRIAIIDLGGYP